MASNGGGAASSGGSNKMGVLLGIMFGVLAIAAGGIVIFTGRPLTPSGDVTPTSIPSAAPKSNPTPASATPPPAPPVLIDKVGLRGSFPNAIVLTLAAYGLPARVGIQAENDNEVYTRGAFDPAQGIDRACNPATQHPGPCVYYIVVQRGASVTVSAGDARAGNWPVLDYLRGAGCDIVGDGKDHTCRVTLGADADLEARFYGSESPGTKFQYPACPPRGCR